MDLEPFTSIPERATCQAGIRVAPSLIPGAGRGLFAQEDISSGGPIFSIKEPRLNIVDDDVLSLSHTCDNCFAAQVDDLFTIDDRDTTFVPCEGCRILHYCSTACQIEAWKHHHIHECVVFQAIMNDPDPSAKSMLNKLTLRSLIRILIMHKHTQIPFDEWKEFISLDPGRKSKMKKVDFASVANTVASVAQTFTKSYLSLQAIVDLFCVFHNNQLVIGLPLLRGARSYDSTTYSVISGGIVLDPLLAMMNHSCTANARWYHNGKEVRVRARTDIKAGDELTICYDPTEDYALRRNHLKNFNIDCSCVICQAGDTGPSGPFRRRMFQLSRYQRERKGFELKDVEKAIADMSEKNFGYGIYPMRDLHQQAYLSHLKKGNAAECLKLALKIYYQIEPIITPPIYEDYRLCTLYTIISILDCPPSGTTHLHELPLLVLKIAPCILLHLREKLARDTETCYGADSIVAKFERNHYSQMLQASMKHTKNTIDHTVHTRHGAAVSASFIKHMDELLKWAGLESVSEEELLR